MGFRTALFGEIQVVSQCPSILSFPPPVGLRLEAAIKVFDSGDNSKELFDEFVALIDKGSKEANYFVGCMYQDGSNGVQQNAEHAFFYYKKSVEGFGYLEGHLAVAKCYYHGMGVPQDYAEAFRYYAHVAEMKQHPVACFMLGRLYQHGAGTGKDLFLARSWYLKAIAQGSIYGMLNLAMLESEEGHTLKSLGLRIRAGLAAFWIGIRNRHDSTLRGS